MCWEQFKVLKSFPEHCERPNCSFLQEAGEHRQHWHKLHTAEKCHQTHIYHLSDFQAGHILGWSPKPIYFSTTISSMWHWFCVRSSARGMPSPCILTHPHHPKARRSSRLHQYPRADHTRQRSLHLLRSSWILIKHSPEPYSKPLRNNPLPTAAGTEPLILWLTDSIKTSPNYVSFGRGSQTSSSAYLTVY